MYMDFSKNNFFDKFLKKNLFSLVKECINIALKEKGKWDKDHVDNAILTVEMHKNKNKNTALERDMGKCPVATLTMVKSPDQDPPLKELQQMRPYPGKVFTPVASSSTNSSWLSWLWGSSYNNRPEMNGKVMCL